MTMENVCSQKLNVKLTSAGKIAFPNSEFPAPAKYPLPNTKRRTIIVQDIGRFRIEGFGSG